MNSLKIKKNDKVVVLSGKDKGKQGKVLGTVPPWGALSGVRPTKLSTKCMLEGGSEKDAARLLEKTYFVTPERSRLCVDASKHTLEAAKLLEPGDLSVYIGIPFCLIVAFCSLYSAVTAGTLFYIAVAFFVIAMLYYAAVCKKKNGTFLVEPEDQ